ncbi:UNVERIFIED_CONTAM: hypothetical protein FKN15_039899 [Acipenser sinensis]
MIIVQVHPRHAQRDPGARIVVAVEEVRVMLLKPFTILARWTIVLEVYRFDSVIVRLRVEPLKIVKQDCVDFECYSFKFSASAYSGFLGLFKILMPSDSKDKRLAI